MRDNQLETYELYGGDVVLEYNDALHEYYYQGDVVPSTTKIIDEVLAKHALKFWAVKVTVEWLKKQLNGERLSENQLDAILKTAKGVHLRESDKATTIGSNVHNWIEAFVHLVMETGETWPEDWKENNPVRLSSVAAKNSVNAFLNWYAEHDVQFLEAERKVYSIKYNYSGTFDLLAIVDGVTTIIDFKTSKHIYPDYLVQGAAYWGAYNEEIDYMTEGTEYEYEDDIRPDHFTVLRLPKDGENWETSTIESIDAHWEIFRHAREMFDWIYKDLNNINPKKQSSSMDTVQYL